MQQRPLVSTRLNRWLAALAISFVALAIALPPEAFLSQQRLGRYRFHDASVYGDLVGQLNDGRLSGRDFIYIYGPLFQIVHGWGLLCDDVASIRRWFDVPPTILTTLGLWWLLSRTGAGSMIRAGLLLAWLAVMAAPGDFEGASIKPMFALVLVAGSASLVADGRAWTIALAWFATPWLLVLYSFDVGILSAIALVTIVVWIRLTLLRCNCPAAEPVRSRWRFAIFGLVASGVAALAGSAFSSTLLHFFNASWDLASHYQANWAWPGKPAEMALLLLPLLVGGSTGVLAAFAARRAWQENGLARAPLLLGGAAAYAAAVVRYGMTRSDLYHLWPAMCPALFLLAALWPGVLASGGFWLSAPKSVDLQQRARPIPPLAWLLVACLVPFTFTQTFRVGWKLRAGAWAQTSLAPSKLHVDDAHMAAAIDAAHALPDEAVAIWPYGSVLGRVAGKRNPVDTIHFTEAYSDAARYAVLKSLSREPRAPVLLYTDAIPLDGFANPTRTSELFRYLVENHRLDGEPKPGFALLRRTAVPVAWQETPIDLVGQALQFSPGDNRAIELSLAAGDCRASDLLALTLRAADTPLHSIFKPGWTAVVLVLDSKQTIVRLVPLPMDGRPHELLLTALELDDPLFAHYFAERAWRSQERIVKVQIGWRPLDFLTRAPAEIDVEKVAVLVRPGFASIETPLSGQHRESVARWVWFGGDPP